MKSITLLFCFFCAIELSGQAHFTHLSVEDGLSQNSILAILQDKRGYLWLGTEDGLNRYDGYSFKKYFQNEADTLGLVSDQIWSMIEADDGKIWIGHANGISYFDPQRHTFVNVLIEENLYVVSSYIDSNDNLWFGAAGNGLFRITNKGLKIEKYLNTAPAPERYDSSTWFTTVNYITSIIENREDLIIGTRGTGFWSFSNGSFSRLNLITEESDFFASNVVWSMVKDSAETLYVGTMKGLAILSPDYSYTEIYSSGETPNSPGKFPISRLCFDKDMKKLWMASYGGGLYQFNLNSKKFIQYSYDKSQPGNLSGNLAYTLLLDNTDNLWIGTWGAGLNKLSRNARNIYKYNSKDGLEDVFITGITNLNENSVIVSTYTGGIYTGVKSGNDAEYVFRKISLSDKIKFNYSKAVHVGVEKIWIGLEGRGVAFIDRELINKSWGYYQKIPSNPNTLNQQLVEVLLEDPFGDLLVGSWGGGLKKIFTKKEYGTPGSIQNIESDPNNPASLSGSKVVALHIDELGFLWVGTESGLNKSRKPISSDSIANDFIHFGNHLVQSIAERNNVIWVGTDHGLYHLDENKLIQDNRLSDHVINSIIIDDYATLWVTTNQGLFALAADRPMQRFASSDGLQSNEFNIRAAARIGDDIIIGGIGGINTFNAKKLISYAGTAPAVVNKVTINNKRFIDDPKTVELSPEDKIIEFSFTSFDFTNPELNQFEYRLLGFDSNWITNPSSRTATYTNLDAGNYDFEVRLRYADGDQTFTLPMVVKPPFWKTTWAYAGYGIIVIVLGLLARKNIVNRERLKAKLELEHLQLAKFKELDDFKSKFFANISHEFRTPLTLILGHTDELKEADKMNKETLQSIRNNSHAVLNLVNQLLDLSKIDAGKLNLHIHRIEVVAFFTSFVEMFESLAFQKEIELVTIFPKREQHLFADPSLLEKIIVNLLSNAIKYSKPGDKVSTHVSVLNDELILEVEDTGVGIATEDLERIFDRFYRVSHHGDGTGIGLSLTKELVTLHKGTIRAFSLPGEGSKFQVKLPVALSSYPESDYEIKDYEDANNPPGLFDIGKFDSSLEDQIVKEAPILLIVEDNKELQQYLERNLKHDFNIILASTGDDGLVKSNLAVPDIVLSDWMMPGMDGEEMCSRLKTDEVTSHIPIVMLTAKADLDSKITGLEIGADDYITKPFEMRELKARLKNLIAQRKQLKEKYSQLSFATSDVSKKMSLDEQFIKRLYNIIEDNLSNTEMNVDWLSREMGVSRVQLHRKLTALVGKSGTLLLREYKLKRAAELLRGNVGNVSEVAYQVGFNNLSYFTKVFKDKYRVTPSEFA